MWSGISASEWLSANIQLPASYQIRAERFLRHRCYSPRGLGSKRGDRTMRQLGTGTLHVEPATITKPARVAVAVAGPTARLDEVVYLTVQCVTLDGLEGQINGL